MVNKFWNKQLLGIPTAIIIILKSVYNKVINYLTTFFYKKGFAFCGKGVKISRGFYCRYPGKIFLHDGVFIDRDTILSAEQVNTIIVDKGASIGRKCKIDFTGGVIIGEMAHLAEGVQIITHDHGYDYKSIPKGKSLKIGKNVFIGMNSIILHNVSEIGDNAVIGVGSIVTKDIPSGAIFAGSPAKLIKYRDDIAKESLKI